MGATRILLLSFVVLFLSCIQQALSAQDNKVADSLLNALKTAPNDTVRARLFRAITDHYSRYDSAQAFRYAAMGLQHVENMKWKRGIGVFHGLFGMIYSEYGRYDSAIHRDSIALMIHEGEKDQFNTANLLNNLGTAWLRKAFHQKAIESYSKALTIAEQLGNTGLQALCLNNIAGVYFNQNNMVKSLDHNLRALQLYDEADDPDGAGEVQLAIGNIYLVKKDTINARKYFEAALLRFISSGNESSQAKVYSSIAIVTGDYEAKLSRELKAYEIWNRINPAFSLAILNLGNIAFHYIEIAQTDSLRLRPSELIPATKEGALEKAAFYLKMALTLNREFGDIANYSFLKSVEAEYSAAAGNYKNAYESMKLFHELNDSIYSQENKNLIAESAAEQELRLRDQEIELNRLRIRSAESTRWWLITGLALLAVIGVLLFRQSLVRKKVNNKLTELNKQLDKSNQAKSKFMAILSHDLRAPVARLLNFLHLQKETSMLSAEHTAIHQQRITVSAESLLQNMETLLSWSKSQMDQFRPVINEFNLQELFGMLSENFSSVKNIRIDFKDVPAGAMIRSDRHYLYTIMVNLTANAVNALDQKENGYISWHYTHEEGSKRLIISDNGPGITGDPFMPVLNANALAAGKNGFGLFIVNDLARSIGAVVELEKSDSMGTVICISLPGDVTDSS